MVEETDSQASAKRGHLLIVEDDEPSRRLLRDIFLKNGYLVAEAVDGEDALRAVEASPPDVILLDIMMPGPDGLEVCRRLKADARTSPIPILLVTALHERSDRLKGIACGANDFITKPIDTEEVLLRVRNAFCMKRLYDERNALLRMREALSDMIVHDIRNPLLGISLSALQIDTPNSPAPIQALARTICGQAELIDRFIGDLLEVSRMEQPSFRLSRSRVNLADLARRAADHHQPQASAKKIRLRVVAPQAPCVTEADDDLLVRLLENLLANAVKFSPENSDVCVRLYPRGESAPACRVCVEDEGPGVPIGYRETIFEKFSCVKLKDFSVRQTGLGLAFCRMVAEAHGGRISVEARQPRGSVFTVELP